MTDLLKELEAVVGLSDAAKHAALTLSAEEWESARDALNDSAVNFLRTNHATITNNAEAAKQLGELLAVIHADGGHYLAEHGSKKATVDAISIWSAYMRSIDEATDMAKQPE